MDTKIEDVKNELKYIKDFLNEGNSLEAYYSSVDKSKLRRLAIDFDCYLRSNQSTAKYSNHFLVGITEDLQDYILNILENFDEPEAIQLTNTLINIGGKASTFYKAYERTIYLAEKIKRENIDLRDSATLCFGYLDSSALNYWSKEESSSDRKIWNIDLNKYIQKDIQLTNQEIGNKIIELSKELLEEYIQKGTVTMKHLYYVDYFLNDRVNKIKLKRESEIRESKIEKAKEKHNPKDKDNLFLF